MGGEGDKRWWIKMDGDGDKRRWTVIDDERRCCHDAGQRVTPAWNGKGMVTGKNQNFYSIKFCVHVF